MEKNLPCRFTNLLNFVFAMVLFTTSMFAQDPANCGAMSTLPIRTCVNGNALYSPTVNAESIGKAVTWTMTVNTTGAIFVETGNGAPLHRVITGIPAQDAVAVKVGPNAGTLTVVLSYDGTDEGSCSASRIVRKVQVAANFTALRCAQDLSTVTAVATTQTIFNGPFNPSPPYLYTLLPEGIQNLTGVFENVAAGPHTITAKENVLEGCEASTEILINAPPVVPVNAICPGDVNKNACDFVNQDQVNAEFAAWLAQFDANGGTGVITKTITGVPNLGAPNVCGGVVTVTIRAIDECFQEDTCTATFRINAAPLVVPINPGDRELEACDIVNQAQLDAAIAAWLDAFDANGGCDPQVIINTTGNITTCGGILTANVIIRDKCIADIAMTANFRVNAAPALITNKPADVLIPFCDITTAENLALRFQQFLDGFTAIGGCAPTIEILPHANPLICGGAPIVVNAIVRDKCHADVQLQAIFEVRTAVAPQVNRGAEFNLGACLSQAEIDAAFLAFKASVTAIGQCGAVDVIVGEGNAPLKCDGGDVNVTFTIRTRCLDDIIINKVFHVDTPLAPTLICAPDARIACDAQFNHTSPTPAGGCGALQVNLIGIVLSADGLVSTATWDVVDECGRHSAQCSQVITREECDFNGCTLGYWKNHTLAWDCYQTCTKYGEVFLNAPDNLKDLTLLQVLNLGGNGNCENLGRQSVAALLNICDGTLNFRIATIAELQAQVNTAFLNGTCINLGNVLDGFNNEGGANHCDVEKSPNNKNDQCNGARTAKGVDATGFVAPTFKVFPNPFNNSFLINSSNIIDPVRVSVFDALGRQIETRMITPNKFDIESFGEQYQTGMYSIMLNQGTEQKVLRIIKK